MSHTFAPPSGSPEPSSAVVFCSSMKWLPPPSVPRFMRSSFDGQRLERMPLCAVYSSKPSQFCVTACDTPSPTGMRSLSFSWNARRNDISANASAGMSVSVAIMPQPMSTPTAAGMTAPFAATTPPMGIP